MHTKREWPQLSKTKRKLARRRLDWRHDRSQLNLGDIGALYDDLLKQHGIKLSDDEVLRQVISSAHITSAAILRISPEIWFNSEAKP